VEANAALDDVAQPESQSARQSQRTFAAVRMAAVTLSNAE
jgi:hypothetical protein